MITSIMRFYVCMKNGAIIDLVKFFGLLPRIEPSLRTGQGSSRYDGTFPDGKYLGVSSNSSLGRNQELDYDQLMVTLFEQQ